MFELAVFLLAFITHPPVQYHTTESPVLCISGNNQQYNTGKLALTEWQYAIRNYTNNKNIFPVRFQHIYNSSCTIYMMYMTRPGIYDPDGVVADTLFDKNHVADIWIYTTEYWHQKMKYYEDKSYKLRPLGMYNPDIDPVTLLHITEHELGHALDILHHNKSNSIMVTEGIRNAHITPNDAREVVTINNITH